MNNPYFDNIQKNFGFGFMRLPMIGEDVDIPQTKQMVDTFLENGFNYFDTAHPYINGKSELALKECLTSRYPRDRYILTNKLSPNCFEKQEDIRPFLEQQLEACGVKPEMVRMSIGIENIEDILADLDQALKCAEGETHAH